MQGFVAALVDSDGFGISAQCEKRFAEQHKMVHKYIVYARRIEQPIYLVCCFILFDDFSKAISGQLLGAGVQN